MRTQATLTKFEHLTIALMCKPIFRTLFHALAFGLVLLLASGAKADVRLPQIFHDHMVIQRDQPVQVWGWAAPNERVTVLFAGTSELAKTNKQGRWSVTFPGQPAGGPFELVVQGKKQDCAFRRSDWRRMDLRRAVEHGVATAAD